MDKILPEVLETERLILRPLTMNDKEAIFKWTSDPRVSKFMLYSNYKSIDDADSWLENLYTTGKELDYGFVLKETGELIGSGGINNNEEHGRANYNVKKIVGVFAVDNPNSGTVMEKLGMSFYKDCEYTKFDGSETFKAKNYEILFE